MKQILSSRLVVILLFLTGNNLSVQTTQALYNLGVDGIISDYLLLFKTSK